MASGKYNVSQGSTAVLPSHPQRIQVHGLTTIKGIVVEVVVVVVVAITKTIRILHQPARCTATLGCEYNLPGDARCRCRVCVFGVRVKLLPHQIMNLRGRLLKKLGVLQGFTMVG